MMKISIRLAVALITIAALGSVLENEPAIGIEPAATVTALTKAVPFTEVDSFTEGVEGPACDADGNVYAVNFGRQQTIGRVTPSGQASLFVTLPGESCGNGIRFGKDGSMFIADYVAHKILRVRRGTTEVETFAENLMMHQPNDLTITSDGTIYASDPEWSTGNGRVWRITPRGVSKIVVEDLALPNGIEISPDGKTLYVAQTKQANILAFDVLENLDLANKRVLIQFGEHLVDGIRCDAVGNLYVARYDAGVVAAVSASGKLIGEVDVLGNAPTNLCFSPDQRHVYVTEVEHRRLVTFSIDQIQSAPQPTLP